MGRDVTAAPLTLGTAGHIDHGKTALVGVLTGVDTDRLPEERARGISIALGYAPLELPSGRRLSVVDVPGHERFVRTMVAGASGIDLYLMVIAADDGVMPQTREHAAVLAGLGVADGVVAVTKADLADPGPALAAAHELLPGAEAIACSARTRRGVEAVAVALERIVARVPSRAELGDDGQGPVLHVDRSFTVKGIGTVVTGTLWCGVVRAGDALVVRPGDHAVRVRGLQVHDASVTEAAAGQRVAVNLAGVRARAVSRGDVLTASTGTAVAPRLVLDCALALRDGRHGERVQVHHGTRDVAGRLVALGDDLWQLRLERPVLAADGDRIVIRRLAPPDTLGGGTILDAAALRHGRRPELVRRLERRRDGGPEPAPPPVATAAAPPAAAPCPRDPALVEPVAARLRDAGTALLSRAQLGDDAEALPALRAAGRAVRVSGELYADAAVAADVEARIVALLDARGAATLGEVRDALGLSRKSAQAFLERLDAERVTRRRPDDRRVLLRRAARSAT